MLAIIVLPLTTGEGRIDDRVAMPVNRKR